MKKTIISILTFITVTTTVTIAGSWDFFYEEYVEGRLELGMRSSYFKFTDDEKRTYDNGTLVGGYTRGISTYRLEEKQNYIPTFYGNYKFNEYAALMVAWEYLKGRAWTLDQADPHYDGDVIAQGPSFQLMGRYPNETLLTPYLGAGFVYLFADFEEEEDWHANGLRNMYAEDTTGFMLTGGCSADVYENVQLDLMFSYLKAESDAKYQYRGQSPIEWKWPLDSWIVSLGVKYLF